MPCASTASRWQRIARLASSSCKRRCPEDVIEYAIGLKLAPRAPLNPHSLADYYVWQYGPWCWVRSVSAAHFAGCQLVAKAQPLSAWLGAMPYSYPSTTAWMRASAGTLSATGSVLSAPGPQVPAIRDLESVLTSEPVPLDYQ